MERALWLPKVPDELLMETGHNLADRQQFRGTIHSGDIKIALDRWLLIAE